MVPDLRRPGRLRLRAGLLAAAVLLGLAGCAGTAATSAPAAGTAGPGRPSATASAGTAPASALAPARATTSLRVVHVAALPPEAVHTLELIDAGGPFPYSRDGVVFGNNERLLPARPSGYYREYTVTTPGATDRGARRIIAGAAGERFYTDDHYASFREVVDP